MAKKPSIPNPDYYNAIARPGPACNQILIYGEWYFRGDDGVLRTREGKELKLESEVKPDGSE